MRRAGIDSLAPWVAQSTPPSRGGTLVPLASCTDVEGMDARNPARGPGQLVGNGDPVSDGNFLGGGEMMPEPREVVRVPEEGFTTDWGPGCRDYGDALALENPVNVGVCPSLPQASMFSQLGEHPRGSGGSHFSPIARPLILHMAVCGLATRWFFKPASTLLHQAAAHRGGDFATCDERIGYQADPDRSEHANAPFAD